MLYRACWNFHFPFVSSWSGFLWHPNVKVMLLACSSSLFLSLPYTRKLWLNWIIFKPKYFACESDTEWVTETFLPNDTKFGKSLIVLSIVRSVKVWRLCWTLINLPRILTIIWCIIRKQVDEYCDIFSSRI